MYTTCPKCGYQRQPEDDAESDTCPACGVIFSKWMKQQFAPEQSNPPAASLQETTPSMTRGMMNALFYVEDKINPFYFWCRVILYVVLLVWGWRFIQMDFIENPSAIGQSFLHRINLVFHEAGHIIFQPFGWFMTKLGGTLGQLLMPAVVMLAFIIKGHNPFGASVGLWWLGQSFMDCAPYIDDALHQDMVLLGGVTGSDRPGYHDWNSILGDMNMLERHREFANFADNTGTLLMLLAFAWGGYILFQQYKHLDNDNYSQI